MGRRGAILFFMLILFAGKGVARTERDTLRNLKVLPLPMIWYTPETRFGLGIAAMFSFRFNPDDSDQRVSSVQIGEAFTQEKQWINFSSYQLFPGKFYLYGESGYYQYRYYFFGTGNEIPPDKSEQYDIDFTRIRTNFTYQFIPKFYAGIRYWFEKHKAQSTDTTGFLLNQEYEGYPTGLTSSPGLVFLYDSRDHIFFPTKGWFGEFSFQRDDSFTGSDFSFSRISLDVSGYFPIEKHVFALNGYSIYSPGNVPFSQMAMLGGNKKMRGYYEGRFRDHLMLLLQAEIRLQIFPRWFLNAYVSTGWVADTFSHLQIQYTRFSGGLGLRFRIDVKNKINLRLDSALGRDGLKNYFTFNEAF